MLDMIVFVLVLGTIIMVHELGHFIAAKTFGVYCGEFSLGMGPSIWHKKKGETEYHIRALPIGGFVAMAGEVDQEENEAMKDVPFERTLKGIKTWKQVIIMAAGVIMNFILALVLLIGINLASGQIAVNTNEVGGIVENSVAQKIELEAGDLITDIYYEANQTHYSVTDWVTLGEALSSENHGINEATTNVIISINRNGTILQKEATLTYQETSKNYSIGIYGATRRLNPIESIKYAFLDVVEMFGMIFDTLAKLVTDSKNTISQLSGPVGIYQATSEITASGQISTLMLWMAMLSVNVGVFNLLPIPGLDGSQIMFAIIEKVMGKEIPAKLRYFLQLAGLILVFGLMIVVSIQDITKLF